MAFDAKPPDWDDYFKALLWRRYFDEHGCSVCTRKDALYGGCMMCVSCLDKYVERMREIETEL